ncbi:hypothetical protein WJX72_012243 [[Myrmecia] bisecta]|uniref:Hexosyltransferase n=1 Tax=[Myrmecia] bisecta TaxID=41462 RepID=A0AAW1PHF0_9CHLO
MSFYLRYSQGVRTYIGGNKEASDTERAESAAYNEVLGFYPDDDPPRSFYAADSRAALMPFLAHRQVLCIEIAKDLGDTYKWLLYGDDDTIWFMDAVMNMVEDLDPHVPYFLTDHMWWSSGSGNEEAMNAHSGAPRCRLCGYQHPAILDDPALNLPEACPYCQPEMLCTNDTTGALSRPPKPCAFPRLPERTYSVHGGAGAIFSVGLLRRVDFASMERCVLSQYSTGGDAYISMCLWEAGFAATDPLPGLHPKKRPFFDSAGPNYLDEDFREKYNRHVQNLLQAAAGECTGICRAQAKDAQKESVNNDEAAVILLDEVAAMAMDGIARRTVDRVLDQLNEALKLPQEPEVPPAEPPSSDESVQSPDRPDETDLKDISITNS